MSLPFPINPSLRDLPVYQPGRPIEEVARELGLPADSIIKLASNEMPFPPLDGASVLGGLVPERAAVAVRGFTGNPIFSLLGILVAWQVFPKIAGPIFDGLLRLVHPHDRFF